MRAISFPLEKFSLLLVYLQPLFPDFSPFLTAGSIIFFLLSHYMQGWRIYTPILLLTLVLNALKFSTIKMIVMPIAGIAMLYFKVYHLELIDQGEYKVGYKRATIRNGKLHLAIFYPTLHKGQTIYYMKNVPLYKKVMYDILHLDPKQPKIIPRFLFDTCVTYMEKMVMPVQGNAKLHIDHTKHGFQVIIFSHGAGGTMHTYSSFAENWASKGRIVISIHHEHDRLQVHAPDDMDRNDINQVAKYLYNWRNHDLQIRASQFNDIYHQIDSKEILSQIFQQNVKVRSIISAGHSYGCATVLQALAKQSRPQNKLPSGEIVLLDPWLFPLSPEIMDFNYKQKILIINSQNFLSVLPEYNQMQPKLNSILKSNNGKVRCLMIQKTVHMNQSDVAYISGTTAKIFKMIRDLSNAQQILGLNMLVVETFLNDYSESQIIEKANQYAQVTRLKSDGVNTRKQFRFTREQTMKYCAQVNKPKTN